MRGKEAHNAGDGAVHRITPAYAGKSPVLVNLISDYVGSPPRMRGKAPQQMLLRSTSGITPAYAGKSQAHQSYELPRGDHPRVCGEKSLLMLFRLGSQGSPPRMRGKVF